MTDGRWQQISRLYHAARGRSPSERDAFLSSECGDDHALLREVDSLLSHDLASTPAVDVLAADLAAGSEGAAVGARLASYELRALIGKGGMGEVYLAHDTELGRDVAIKILPPIFAADPARRVRFEREARTLASISHRHIGAIYGVAEGNGLRGLVLELLEGDTLAERIAQANAASGHGMPMPEALEIARQIADGMDAAHERGIVHRDLKPANIKITPDDAVKVLDFGLAKPAAPDDPMADGDPAAAKGSSREGVILGTAAYMSPEQALGHAVDKRTDIWAFGCIVFEMLTGRAPFDGETILEIRAAILGRDPDWSLLPPSTPPAVAGLIRRCLDKHLKSRLRDIGDAFEALDHVPSSAAPQRVSVAGGTWDRRLMAAVTASAAVVLILTASWIVGRRDAPVPPVFSRVVRLTTGPALDFGPAISPDGSWIAYLSNARGPVDIYVKFPASGAAANLTADSGLELPARSEVGGLAVSPDGASIAFDAGARPGTPSNLFDGWVIPAPLGGIPRKLVERGRSIRWSPDGTLIAYVRAGAAAGDALYVADADGTNERELVPTRGGMHLHWPAWSADGRYVYFSYGPATANGEPTEIHRVSITGGGREPIVRTVRRALYAAPTPDGTALVYAANPFTTELGLWWRWLSPGAVARPLTTGVGEYAEVAMARRGSQLVASIVESRETLISIDVTAAKAPEATLADGSTGDQDPTLSPVGDELVFSSSRNGNRSLWAADGKGASPRPLTSGTTLDERPSYSPDGRRIAFISDRGGERGIWLMNADGGAPRLVTRAPTLDGVSWSPAGGELVYATAIHSAPGLSIVSVDTGTVRRLATPGPAAAPAWCPARDVIAYVEAQLPAPHRPSSSRVAFVNSLGQSLYPGLAESPNVLNGFLAWSPDCRYLAAFVEPGASTGTVWVLDTQGVEPARKLLDLPPGTRLRGAAWTGDATTIVMGQRQRNSDIVLFEP